MKPIAVAPELESTLAARVQTIADDHLSGASTLTRLAIAVLIDARVLGAMAVETVACRLCKAQPAMAPLWNAAALAVGEDGDDAVQRLAAQVDRAPRALARVFVDLMLTGRRRQRESLAVATISSSESVRLCLEALARSTSLQVISAEGRPLLEGRGLAIDLAAAGVAVTVCTDAALSAVVDALSVKLDAIVVGADAVTPRWFVNKCGTGQLASSSSATVSGVPAYVVAGREKFVGSTLAAQLTSSGGPPEEVWDAPPHGVTVANPYFEKVPLEVAAMFVTDVGAIGPGSVPELCQSAVSAKSTERLASILRESRSGRGDA